MNEESILTMGESIVANGVSGGVRGTDGTTFTGGVTFTSEGYNLVADHSRGNAAACPQAPGRRSWLRLWASG
jgi:hypothetical protein